MRLIASGSSSVRLPSQIVSGYARQRFLEFFTAQVRNANTRRSYVKAALDFLTWCEARAARSLARSLDAITPIYVAGWVEEMTSTHSAPTVKQRLAAVRHLFD